MAKTLLKSPKGTFGYVYLNTPDTKFKPEGEFKVPLILPRKSAEAKALMQEIDKQIVAAVAQARKDNPKIAKKIEACEDKAYRFETDDDDSPTGNVIFTFKMKASGKSRKTGKDYTRRPALFDAFGKPVDPAKVSVGKGTVGRVSYQFNPFFQTTKVGAGVSLWLEGVQIIDLVEYNGMGDAAAHGFEEEDGGSFAADDLDEEEEDATDSEDEEDEEAEDADEESDEEGEDEDSEDDEDEDGEEDEEDVEEEDETPPARRARKGKAAKAARPAPPVKKGKKAAKPAAPAKKGGRRKPAEDDDDEF